MFPDGKADFEGNEYFKAVVEDALASLEDPLELTTHVVDRITQKNPELTFGEWYAAWVRSDERERVVSALSKLSQSISKEIFGSWKEVLGSDLGRKELVIDHIVEEGEDGSRLVFLELSVKDGYSTFKIAERSLGFRWFFCFMIFTRFFRGTTRGGTMFLFDEPASNLHSKAQSKLLDSLETIASGGNDVIYSTHSHHLINPLWLETTFVITNGVPTHGDSIDENFGVEDIDIEAQSYRSFVGRNAEKSHYFQPILDRLQVSPSLLEVVNEGVFAEGKSDYYILNWYLRYHGVDSGLNVVPVGGATNARAVISLYLGMTVRFVVLLDSDAEGNRARQRYIGTLPVSPSAIVQIGDVFGTRKKKIEDLVSRNVKSAIGRKYGLSRVHKKHILRAFSEACFGENDLPDDEETIGNLKNLVDELTLRIDQARSDG